MEDKARQALSHRLDADNAPADSWVGGVTGSGAASAGWVVPTVLADVASKDRNSDSSRSSEASSDETSVSSAGGSAAYEAGSSGAAGAGEAT